MSKFSESSSKNPKNKKSVRFPKDLDEVVRRHLRYPSLVNSETAKGRKGDPQLRHDANVIRELEKLARVRAWELNVELDDEPDHRQSFAEEYDTFFTDSPVIPQEWYPLKKKG